MTSGFHSGADVGSGTAEYVGVALPMKVGMILTLPAMGTSSFLLAFEEKTTRRKDSTLSVEDRQRGDDTNETDDAFTTVRRVGVSTPPPITAPAVVPAAAEIPSSAGEFLLAPPPKTGVKIGSSVPAAGPKLFSTFHPVGSAGLAPPPPRTPAFSSSFHAASTMPGVASSFHVGGRSALARREVGSFFGAVAAKNRAERRERRSSTEGEDALGKI